MKQKVEPRTEMTSEIGVTNQKLFSGPFDQMLKMAEVLYSVVGKIISQLDNVAQNLLLLAASEPASMPIHLFALLQSS
jgi:hypothetical protein